MNAGITFEAPASAPAQPGRRERAPGALRLVQDFVNTRDIEAGTDDIADAAGLHDWLGGRDLLPADDTVATADVTRAATFREALRALLFVHHGEPLDRIALQALNDAATEARLSPRFTADGGYRLEPDARGISGALGRIVAAVSEAMDVGTWSRLKACRNDTCQWAFYDSSRNRSGSWCSMAVCGNRMKGRAYRRRHQGEKATAPD